MSPFQLDDVLEGLPQVSIALKGPGSFLVQVFALDDSVGPVAVALGVGGLSHWPGPQGADDASRNLRTCGAGAVAPHASPQAEAISLLGGVCELVFWVGGWLGGRTRLSDRNQW